MRLFVDCDGTLVIYDKDTGKVHPYGLWKGDPCHVNEPLVAFVLEFHRRYPDNLITIWSGGGGDYAAQVAKFVGLGDTVSALCIVKDKTTFGLIRHDDIVVDDEDLVLEHLPGYHPVSPGFFGSSESWTILDRGTHSGHDDGLDHSGDNCSKHVCLRGPRGIEGKPGGVQ